MTSSKDKSYLQQAIRLAREGIGQGKGGPFGCIIVKADEVIGTGNNLVTSTNDPTAHAEVVAIREACAYLNSYQLTGCTVYASCEPCPMCLGAIYWARPDRLVYASTRLDAADAGFDDDLIYREIALPAGERQIPFVFMPEQEALDVFRAWKKMSNKKLY
ncbi:MAG: nucleoside deaminase [Bacteroidota bacterium]|nr:nucleoside deaminase [Bacteroidota bacterium]MDP4246081.1 nucleoside deaminase [Bacteroidota bacterium]MDP4259434.1 nucleoside deaminase [Bacteroidota bacterium]